VRAYCWRQQPVEITAVNILTRWGMSVSAATVALTLVSGATQARGPAAVAHVAPAATKQPAHKAASKCGGLDETACSASPGCTWAAATKTKTGKDVTAYCRTKPKITSASAKPRERIKK
jgi:hypothetical protein